jgi:putative PepSY-like beta-lactamase-inhibitor
MISLTLCATLTLPAFLAIGPPLQRSSGANSRALPSNVMAALTARFPQAKIDQWTKEKEAGKEVYDVEFRQADRKFEADIFADGTIHNWEQQIAASDLPQPVMQAVHRQFPKAEIKEIMAVTAVTNGSEHLEGYEVVVKRALKKDVEMTIAPDGKILEGPKKE